MEKGARVWVMRASSGSFGCVARDETASYFAQDDRVWGWAQMTGLRLGLRMTELRLLQGNGGVARCCALPTAGPDRLAGEWQRHRRRQAREWLSAA